MAILKPKEIAERSGITVLILQRWDNNGALKAYCAPMLKVLFLMKQLLKEVMDNDKHCTCIFLSLIWFTQV